MVARELRIPHVIIPRAPGHFSAFGMLLADFRRDLVRSHFITLAELSLPQLDAWFGELEAEGLRTLDAAEVGTRKIMVQRHLDMRYIGQEHAVTVEIPAAAFKRKNLDALKAVFDEAHRERYGRGSPNEPAEIVSLRSTVIGVLKKPVLETIRSGSRKPVASALRGHRQVYFEGEGWLNTQVYHRDELRANNRLEGPALIEEHATTTVLQPGDRLQVDAHGNLHIDVAQTERQP
jgi:N-methylhydantoinase A